VLLVLRALKLGDLLTAVPALRALDRAFPDDELVLAAPGWLAPLALHTGAVDRVVDTAPLGPLDPSLHGADLAVNLHGRGPESTAVLAATGPRRLLAFDVPGGPRWRDEEHDRDRWCRLLSDACIPADPDDLRLAPPPVEPPPLAVGATLLHPGASSASRRWPAARWAAVARSCRDAGDRVVLTGDRSEVDLAAEVADLAGLPPSHVLAGRTDLLGLLATVGAASRVVSGDTGTAHVASALGTPSVLLFGPTPPRRWGPPADGPHVVLWSGATGDPHGTRADPGLLAIGVDDVIRALGDLPPRRREGDARHTART
jgi:ADP-heptose:LPS heptosyltransferase